MKQFCFIFSCFKLKQNEQFFVIVDNVVYKKDLDKIKLKICNVTSKYLTINLYLCYCNMIVDMQLLLLTCNAF